jgi:hypothetical protein
MSQADGLSEKAASVLAKFPGPVRLPLSPTRAIIVVLGTLLYVAVGFLFVISGDSVGDWRLVWIGYAVIGLSCFLTMIAVMSLIGGNSLVLDSRGFRRSSRILEDYPWLIWNLYDLVPWDEASDFTVTKKKNLRYQRSEAQARGWNDRLARRTLNVLLTYGFAPEDFVRLMSAWRERALSQSD